MVNDSKTSREVHFCAVSSLTAIIKLEIEVLKLKLSMSSSTFFMVLCRVFKLSGAAGLSVTKTLPFSPVWNNLQKRFKTPCTPEIPAVLQGFSCSNGPKNNSYIRQVSSPYSSQITSGLTTLNLDFDILSTSLSTT